MLVLPLTGPSLTASRKSRNASNDLPYMTALGGRDLRTSWSSNLAWRSGSGRACRQHQVRTHWYPNFINLSNVHFCAASIPTVFAQNLLKGREGLMEIKVGLLIKAKLTSSKPCHSVLSDMLSPLSCKHAVNPRKIPLTAKHPGENPQRICVRTWSTTPDSVSWTKMISAGWRQNQCPIKEA